MKKSVFALAAALPIAVAFIFITDLLGAEPSGPVGRSLDPDGTKRSLADLQPGDILIENHEIPSAATCPPEADGGYWKYLVRGAFGSGYQHVRIVSTNPTESIENLAVGVRRTPIGASYLGQFELWRPKCSPEVKKQALTHIESHLGEAFGILQGILLWSNRRLGIPTGDVPGMTCSELVATGYTQAGYRLLEARPDHQVTPWDFRNLDRLERIW